MISKIPSIIVLLASMLVISSGYKVSLPSNYTWPLNNTRICFAGRFKLDLNVDYAKTDGSTASVTIPLNDTTYYSYNGSCSEKNHQLTISMLNNGSTLIVLDFSVDSQNMTSLEKVSGYITVDNNQEFIQDYANATAGVKTFSTVGSFFQSTRSQSYRCNTKTQITNFTTTNVLNITSIGIENLKIQPFIDDTKDFGGYGTENVCSADTDKDSNLIPIIVGACLALLVVIVLVAYLIGRRRSRAGYQSV